MFKVIDKYGYSRYIVYAVRVLEDNTMEFLMYSPDDGWVWRDASAYRAPYWEV